MHIIAWGCWVLLVAVSACKPRDLRGRGEPSPDGKTYLSIDDNNGGGCPIFVDGKRWQHTLRRAAAISPGDHTVSFRCSPRDTGSNLTITVQRGTVYHFDYWGP